MRQLGMRKKETAAIVAAAAAGTAVTLSAATAFAFRRSILREDRTEEQWEKKLRSGVFAPYYDEITEAIRWFREQKTEDVSIRTRDGLQLVGSYLEAPEAKGCVLLFHGFHSKGAIDFALVLPLYYQHGYSVLVVDQRSHGRSQGRYIGYGILERHDCQQWAWFLHAKTGGKLPIFLEGMSMGAATVMMASNLSMPPTVCGVVADCGYNSAWTVVRGCAHKRYHMPAFPALYLANLMCRAAAGYSLNEMTSAQALAETSLPVLLIHGTGDELVPVQMTAENYEAAAGEKRQVIVEGAAHAGSYLVDRERCEKELLDFLDTHTAAWHEAHPD